MKCDACGAPVENGRCTYCGKIFLDSKKEPATSSCKDSKSRTKITGEPATKIADKNDRLNQKSPQYNRPIETPKKKKGIGCGTILLIFIVVVVLCYIFGSK